MNCVANKEEALKIAELLEPEHPNLIMEEFVTGREYTVLIYGDKMLAGERLFQDGLNYYTENGPFSDLKIPEPEI